jgi:hypothetical protein
MMRFPECLLKSIAYFNSTGGGRVTQMHFVLEGPPRGVIQRHVALSITYGDLQYPSVFVPVGDFFNDQENSKSETYENVLFAKRATNSWWCYATMPYKKSIRIELVAASTGITHNVGGYNYILHDSVPFDESSDLYFHSHYASNPLVGN